MDFYFCSHKSYNVVFCQSFCIHLQNWKLTFVTSSMQTLLHILPMKISSMQMQIEHNIQGRVQRSVQRLKVTICQGKLDAFFIQCQNNFKAKLTLGVNRLNHHIGHIKWFMMVSIRYCQRFELISPKQRHNLQNQSSYAFF